MVGGGFCGIVSGGVVEAGCNGSYIHIYWITVLPPPPPLSTLANFILILKSGGGGCCQRSHFLGDILAAQKCFVRLNEVPRQTLCSLLTSDMLYIASNSMSKTSCTISGTSKFVS